MHVVDRPGRGRGRHRGEQGGLGDPEPDLLALHAALGGINAQPIQRRIAVRFSRIVQRQESDKQGHHHRENNPALLAALREQTKCKEAPPRGSTCTESRSHWSAGTGSRTDAPSWPHKPAPIGAQMLDRFERDHRSHSDLLLASLKRRDAERRCKVCGTCAQPVPSQ